MRLESIHVHDLQSLRDVRVTFQRPVTAIFGLNSAGKTSLARAVQLLLRGELDVLEGRRASVRRIVRAGAEACEVEGRLVPTPGRPELTLRRKLGARGLATWVNGESVTKAAFDFFAPAGVLEPAGVFRVLCCATGFFDVAPEEQKATILSLVDQAVPADLLAGLPFGRIGATVRVLADLDGAHDVAYKRRTSVRARLEALAPVDDPGGAAPDLAAIEARLHDLQAEERRLSAATAETAGERRALEGQAARLRTARDQAAVRLQELGDEVAARQDLEAVERKIAALQAAHEAYQREHGAVLRLESDLGELRRRLSAFAAVGAECPTCTQAIPPALRATVEEAWRRQIDVLTAEHTTRARALREPAPLPPLEIERHGAEQRLAQLAAAQARHRDAQADLDPIEARLRALGPAPASEAPELAAFRQRIETGRVNLDLARQVHRQIEAYAAYERTKGALEAELVDLEMLVSACGPKGLREKILADRVGQLEAAVNAALRPFGMTVAYRTEPWEVQVNGQPALLLAESERFRGGVAHQLALAAATGVRWAVIDGLDILDRPNRAAVLELLRAAVDRGQIEQAIVLGTYTAPAPPNWDAPWVESFVIRHGEDGSVVTRVTTAAA